MEYLGTKMTRCVIRDALKYLYETAESRHDRSIHIIWYVAFIFKGENKPFNLPILSCKIIKAV